jgi:hypothetical protein
MHRPWPLYLLAVWACQSAPPRSPASLPAPAVAAAPAAIPAAAIPAAAPARVGAPSSNAVSEAEARALVAAWLDAQNQGDFSVYQTLYAARFDGIKRVGERISRFDRAGWLKDRERMFQTPSSGSAMHVELAELSLQTAATTARARFVQTFSKGSFSDRGPKELLLVREGSELRIAREELLSSEPNRAPARSAAEGGAFLFVIEQGVVLDSAGSGAAAQGKLQALDPEGSVHVVRSAVDETRLDPALRALRGRNLLLGGRPECKAQIGALWLVVRVDPHFSMVRRWAGEAEEEGGPPGKPASDDEIAAEVWDLGLPELVGELRDVPDGCGAPWARDASLPLAPVQSPSDVVAPRVRKEAERQMLAAVQRVSPPPAGVEPTLELQSVDGKHPLLVGSYARGEGCAEEVHASFVWRVRGTPAAPRLELLNDPERTPDFRLELAIDLDADGRWELLGNLGTRLLEASAAYETGPEIGILALDCMC